MNDTGYVRMNPPSVRCKVGLKTEDEKLLLQRRGKSGLALIFEQ